jgi:di/tricarboxylate transporter
LSDATIVYCVLAVVIVLFVSQRVPVDLVAIGAAIALYLTGVLTVTESLAGFGDPAVIFIASLFVVSEALDATGVTAWASQQLIRRAGGSKQQLLVLTMLLVAVMSALITPNGAVAALVPVIVVLAVRLGRSPSEMLIPLSYASLAGSLIVLTGSPVNVIVAETSSDAGGGGFGYFEFAVVGVPLLLGTVAVAVVLAPRLLPERRPRLMPTDFTRHARTLFNQYALDEPVFRLPVLPDSTILGLTRNEIDLSAHPGVTIIAAQEEGGQGPVERPVLSPGDYVIIRGQREAVEAVASKYRLGRPVAVTPTGREDGLYTRESGIAEVIVPPRSEAIGEAVFPGMVTESGDLIVLAVQRGGEDRLGTTVLQAGDALLLHGPWEALDANLAGPSVVVVDEAEQVRRQVVPLGPRANISIAVLAAMVVALATGVVPAAIAALSAAAALVLARVLTVQQAYRSISWTVVVLIAAMIPVSTAMTKTGAANDIADALVALIGDSSPYLLIVALFVLVAILGQLISNTATALIVFPVAVAASIDLDVSMQPVLMAVNIAAHASFLTPIATTPNLMVMEPGGYRFGDYWKFGAPLMVLYFIVAIGLVPLVWPFN